MKKIKGMQTLDWLMLAMVAFVAYDTNYDDMQTIDYVCLVCVSIWLIMLVIRLYLENFRND